MITTPQLYRRQFLAPSTETPEQANANPLNHDPETSKYMPSHKYGVKYDNHYQIVHKTFTTKQEATEYLISLRHRQINHE